MPKIALLRLSISGLLLLACLLNHVFPRMETPKLRVVPIDRLPRRIGKWKCVRDLLIEPQVRELLPDAAFLSRLYQDDRGRGAQLFLETSQDAQMFHSPTQCMPAQNWNILNTRRLDIASKNTAKSISAGYAQSFIEAENDSAATEMDMQSAGQNLLLLYWYTTERQLDKWQALKTKLLSGRPQTRLFARILVPASEDFAPASQTAQDFAQALQPALAELENR